MIVGSLIDTMWNLTWDHINAETMAAYYQKLYSKIFRKNEHLVEFIRAAKYSHVDLATSLLFPHTSSDSIIRYDNPIDEQGFSMITPLHVIQTKYTPDVHYMRPLKEVRWSEPALMKREVLILSRPLLFETLLNEAVQMCISTSTFKTNMHIKDLLLVLSKAYHVLLMSLEARRELSRLQNYITYVTLKAYHALNNPAETYFEGVHISWNMASYYPVRIHVKETTPIQELTSIIALLNDVTTINDVREIIKTRLQ